VIAVGGVAQDAFVFFVESVYCQGKPTGTRTAAIYTKDRFFLPLCVGPPSAQGNASGSNKTIGSRGPNAPES
jgi:hypothetical protein